MEQIKELGEWITVRQAGELTGYTHEYIREMARDGTIRAGKHGYAMFIHKESLMKYWKSKQRQEA